MLGFLSNRVSVVSTYLWELARNGADQHKGDVGDEALFILDGVGGFQFAPILIRRTFQRLGVPMHTVLFRWQYGLVGEVLTDLMLYRRNRLMGLHLARKLLAFHRKHPKTKMHLVAYSGGAGISVFACEALKQRPIIETLVLACPAISPHYNLAPALRNVRRAYALVSHKDRYLLGIGTRLFGTTDRVFTQAAGRKRFRIPANASDADRRTYERMGEIRWSPELKNVRHHGGHTGWLMVPLLEKHLLPILRGEPRLPVEPVQAESEPPATSEERPSHVASAR